MVDNYINESIRLEYHLEIDWYIALISKEMNNGEFRDGENFKLGTEWVKMKPLTLRDKIKLEKDIMPSVKEEMVVPFGRFIFNALCVDFAFQGAIPFVNESLDVGKYIKKYVMKLSREVSEKEWTDGIKRYSTASKVMGHLVPYAVRSESKKVLHPAPGGKELKKKTIKALKDKYGEDAFQNLGVIAEYEKTMADYDNAYLKSEVDNNVVLATGGKPSLSRKQIYSALGSSAVIVSSPTATFVAASLEEGMSLDPKEFAKIVNDIRSGSLSKGKDTQVGGVISSILTRALHAYTISVDDCKTDDGFLTLVENDNLDFFVGSNVVYNKEIIPIYDENDIKPYIGKTVLYRTFIRCKADAKAFKYCKICAGVNQSLLEDGIALVGAGIGGVYLNILMKQMHDQTIYVTNYDVDDMFT